MSCARASEPDVGATRCERAAGAAKAAPIQRHMPASQVKADCEPSTTGSAFRPRCYRVSLTCSCKPMRHHGALPVLGIGLNVLKTYRRTDGGAIHAFTETTDVMFANLNSVSPLWVESGSRQLSKVRQHETRMCWQGG